MSKRGLIRNDEDCKERLGYSRKTVIRRAREALGDAMREKRAPVISAALEVRGVEVEFSGHRVTVRRAGGKHAIWAEPIAGREPIRAW